MNEKKSITDMEAILLKMWSDAGIECIYKYKNRIKSYREPLPSVELLNDVAGLFFSDIVDIANHRNSAPIDFVVRIKDILREQEQILQNEYDNHISLKYQVMQGKYDEWEVREVATRLRQLVSDWPDDDRDKINALYLAEGMELAHKRNEPLEFI